MILAFIILVALFVYGRALRGEFLFDDPAIVDMEPNFKNGFGSGYVEKWPPSNAAITWLKVPTLGQFVFWFWENRSLTHMGYRWTWQLAGFNPTAWHAVNLALHATNVWLAFILLEPHLGYSLALIAAAMFAVHPLNTATVCYISARAVLQTTMFTLAALIHFEQGHYVLAVLSEVLACRSKEDALVYLPFYAMLRFLLP